METVDVNREKVHIRGLTEIRGIAALFVLFIHIDQFRDMLNLTSIHLHETGMSEYAVTTFFSLSGFLISYLLLLEFDSFKTIDVKKFYIRRILRIWPAYYATIFMSIMLMVLGFFVFPDFYEFVSGLFFFLFMMPNIGYVLGVAFAGTSPLWSIGVEEQFYLIWPWIIKKIKKPLYFLFLIICLSIALKILLYGIHPTGGLYALVKITQIDCMSIGAIFAILIYNKVDLFTNIIYHPLAQIVAVFLLLLPLFIRTQSFANIEIEFHSIASSIWIANTAFNLKSFIYVKSSILRFFGTLSYGIYVYHLIIIYIIAQFDLHLPLLLMYLLAFVAVTGFSYISYYFFESKVLALKEKYSNLHSKA